MSAITTPAEAQAAFDRRVASVKAATFAFLARCEGARAYIGDVLRHLEGVEHDGAAVSQALSEMRSDDEIALDTRHVWSMTRVGQSPSTTKSAEYWRGHQDGFAAGQAKAKSDIARALGLA